MKNLAVLGRYLFAIAFLIFGVQHFIFASTGAGLGPPWTPAKPILAYLAGTIFVLASVSLMAGKQARLGALMLGLVCVARAAIYVAPQLVATPRNPGPWTSGFELLAMCGASLVMAATLNVSRSRVRAADNGASFSLGRFIFALSLIVFGIQHFMYAHFIAGLIPSWIPGHLFWAYFVGVAFIATTLAIVTGKLAHLAATLLGTMFFLWVVVLHAPRVAAAPHNGNEWTSLVVALAMSGGAFALGGSLTN